MTGGKKGTINKDRVEVTTIALDCDSPNLLNKSLDLSSSIDVLMTDHYNQSHDGTGAEGTFLPVLEVI